MILLNTAGIILWLMVVNAAIAFPLHQRIQHYALAKVVGVFFLTALLFFLEHIKGLGKLDYLFPVVFLLACSVLYYGKADCLGLIKKDIPFVIGFLYAFLWLYKYPDIHAGTEHLTDLYFIVNYIGGETLPPENKWYPPHLFDFYYAFQHYQAALLSRLTGMGPGYSYHLAFSMLFGYMAALVWETTRQQTGSAWLSTLLMLTVLVGGTGVSPFMEFIKNPSAPDSSIIGAMRFAGGSEPNTILAPYFESSDRVVQHTALETFGYNLFIGDFHPPISGFVLFTSILVAFYHWQHTTDRYWQTAIIALCAVLVTICNVWILPLVAVLLVFWLIFLYLSEKEAPLVRLQFFGLLSLFLVYPFLRGLANNPSAASIKITPVAEHTPLGLLFIQFWPVILAVTACFLVSLIQSRNAKKEQLGGYFTAAVFITIFIMSELLYVEDGTTHQYNRTNTTMKWWGPMYLFAQLATVWGSWRTACSGVGITIVRVSLIACLLLPTAFNGYFMVRHYITIGSDAAGKLHGHYWLTKDKDVRGILNYLKSAPDGVVLENLKEGAYTPEPGLTMFAEKPAFIGWVNHLYVWKQGDYAALARKAEQESFYSGAMKNPSEWLTHNNIQYIILKKNKDIDLFNAIDVAIQDQYRWIAFSYPRHVSGIWEKRAD